MNLAGDKPSGDGLVVATLLHDPLFSDLNSGGQAAWTGSSLALWAAKHRLAALELVDLKLE